MLPSTIALILSFDLSIDTLSIIVSVDKLRKFLKIFFCKFCTRLLNPGTVGKFMLCYLATKTNPNNVP